ncbi:MAG TPA: chemotaxis protein CheW [Phenylobacterium sp.]|uniref:chemotaxis protein CheW n=1 Tax=Phenylobacterium sp. TaxID=1871053 RepID=UPI002D599A4E|nr:chemotaxis protein CheW [Phenylobacterium sp.]HZZ70361.1 chemotaxis protein CheW [Phenylobacterium sp.]
MADAARDTAAQALARFLTFRVEGRLYAVAAGEVAEIIRVPPAARVPQAPKGLLGVANLRGTVLPLASLRGLLGHEEIAVTAAARAIVLRGAAPVALAVDAVEALVSVDSQKIETRQTELAEEPGERLVGAFETHEGGEVARLLDLQGLLAAAFVPQVRSQSQALASRVREEVRATSASDDRAKLVTFDVAGQEYGLDLGAVQEILAAPANVAVVPRAETVVLGVMAYRETLLPLLSLRGLLGFPVGGADEAREKVVVTTVAGVRVGLVADRMRAIVPTDPDLMDATPPMLVARTGGEARIKAIYRGEGGTRLISVLAPEQLFREDVMQRLGGGEATKPRAAEDVAGEALKFLVFRLGDDEFGLPIETVDEVARVPDQITRLPKAPKFLEGVVNLRGEVLPVVDQRRRFDMPALEKADGRRLVVVRTERHRAGLIVDAVSEVLQTTADRIEPAPDLTGEATRLVQGVLNLEAAGRIVLLLDPAELLTRTERGLLDAFAAASEQAAG